MLTVMQLKHFSLPLYVFPAAVINQESLLDSHMMAPSCILQRLYLGFVCILTTGPS